ncbi:uncharacterized protein TNCV_825951 [Trichonephila clavipes]|nr:uncharacterized protein TNCV_825951 [Trichonephila clavipes]
MNSSLEPLKSRRAEVAETRSICPSGVMWKLGDRFNSINLRIVSEYNQSIRNRTSRHGPSKAITYFYYIFRRMVDFSLRSWARDLMPQKIHSVEGADALCQAQNLLFGAMGAYFFITLPMLKISSLAEIVEVEIYRGRVAIYRPFGEVSLSLNRTVTCMVLKANDRRTSCPCHDEFRRPRSDYVKQVALATTTTIHL